MGFFDAFLGLVFRRGTGLFKLVFALDDLIRLFTMSLVFFLGLSLLGVGNPLLMAGVIFGLIIDIHDIFDDIQSGKPLDLGFN
ncbi:hypothetical protein HY640_02885 [Candidatus Woesearchaeota archaeon]|nr:hypothetical protein [Candidatus Woesearchaeota archaeon]